MEHLRRAARLNPARELHVTELLYHVREHEGTARLVEEARAQLELAPRAVLPRVVLAEELFERGALDYMGDDHTQLEREPLERLAADGQLVAFRHEGFWQPMDTLREKNVLEAHWESGKAPWKVW